MRTRQDLIQLALWGGAIGFLVMGFRAISFASPQAPDLAELMGWVGAGIATGAAALGYSLVQYFRRPRPQ